MTHKVVVCKAAGAVSLQQGAPTLLACKVLLLRLALLLVVNVMFDCMRSNLVVELLRGEGGGVSCT